MASIVSQNFCVHSQELQLFYTRHAFTSHKVTDALNNVIFKARIPVFSSIRLLLTDPNDIPILHIHRKSFSLRDTWTAYAGDNVQLVFTVKQSSVFQMSMSMNVFLGPNPDTESNTPDYKVRSETFQTGVKLYRGSSEQAIAKMKPNSMFSVNPWYEITVAPGVDYAFAVALFLIVIERDSASS